MSELPPEPPPAEPEVTTAAALEPGADHPVRLVVTDDLKRSRLTVFFRLLLAIPHFIWLTCGRCHFFVVIVAWFAALFNGRLPDGMHGFLDQFSGLQHALSMPTFRCSRIPYPPFNGSSDRLPGRPPRRPATAPAPVDDPPADHPGDPGTFGLGLQPGSLDRRLPRLVRLPRIGRMPKGMQDLGLYCLRYEEQTTATCCSSPIATRASPAPPP